MLKCLITCIGSPAIHGTLQMLRENPDGEEVITYGVDANRSVFSKGLPDHFVCIPRSDHPDCLPTLFTLCEKEQIDVILFQGEPEAFLCAAHKKAFEEIGTRLLSAETDALKTSSDKWQLYQALAKEREFIPQHKLVSSKNCEESAYALGYPEKELIAKPCGENGAKGVYRITEECLPWDKRLRIPIATLAQLKKSIDCPVLLMESLPGAEYSVDCVLGKTTAVAIPRRRDQIVAGVATQTTLEHRPDLADFTLKAGKALGLFTLYGMQFREDALGAPKLLECNPRIQGSSIASLYSGVNLVWTAIRELLGKTPQKIPTPKHGSTFARSWEGTLLT